MQTSSALTGPRKIVEESRQTAVKETPLPLTMYKKMENRDIYEVEWKYSVKTQTRNKSNEVAASRNA